MPLAPFPRPRTERELSALGTPFFYLLFFYLCYTARFIAKVQQDTPGHGVKEQLQNLCNVYALYILHKHLGDFLATGCITPKQGALANEQLGKLYAQVCWIAGVCLSSSSSIAV